MTANAERAGDHEPKSSVFISYSRKDMDFADRIDVALKARGFESLIDREGIYAFEDWWKRIQALIGRADTVIFVLSPDSIKSDVALKEVTYAASLNKRFAPIVCKRVNDSLVPELLRKLNFIFFDDDTRFELGADQLAEALQTDIGWIRQHTEYGEAERRWSAAGGPTGMLLHSPALEVAEHWIGSRPRDAPEPTAEIRAYVAASRENKRSSERRAQLLRATIYTLLVGVIAGLLAFIYQDNIEQQWRWYVTERPFVAAKIWPYVLAPEAERGLKPEQSFRECAQTSGKDYCPVMIVVPPGSFVMGSPTTEKNNEQREKPSHTVTIPHAFAVSKFELTFDQWDTCVAYGDCPEDGKEKRDHGWGRGQRPTINVSWDDAQLYVAWLSRMTGRPYRLLSEAEYEYAARGGKQTAYPWGDVIGRNNANCTVCGSQWDDKQTAPVGKFAANSFGLYDMAGNVWEWVQDCQHDNYNGAPVDGSPWMEGDGGNCGEHVVRGGSWNNPPQELRSAERQWDPQNDRYYRLDFRVARTLTP